jgi:hypothetical protein
MKPSPKRSSKAKVRKEKAVNGRAHFKRRVMERFGFEPNRHEIEAAINTIQANRAIPFGRSSANRSRHILAIRGTEMVIVYDRKRKVLVTAWPPNSPQAEQGEDNE